MPVLVEPAHRAQMAVPAPRCRPADLLAVSHNQGVVFSKDLGAPGQLLFEGGTNHIVRLIPMDPPKASKDPARVGIDHEHRPVKGIQQNIVGGLRAHSMHA